MSKIFIGGSRAISRLNSDIRGQLDRVLAKGLQVVIGDAYGADKAVQTYIASKGYKNVVLYCSGDECRNNVGHWEIKNVLTASGVKDFNHYSEKDKEMAKKADFGLFLWDGASKGTLANIRRMIDQDKTSLVYLSTSHSFVTIKSRSDLKNLPIFTESLKPDRKGAPRRSLKAQGTQRLF